MLSSHDDVVNLYEPTADSYSTMMDSEIQSPVYSETVLRLHKNVANLPGPMLDVACGSGHMLALYAKEYHDEREFMGVDLTPRMVQLANDRLGKLGVARVGDMRHLDDVPDDSVAAVLNFFAIHHLDQTDLGSAIVEWHRLLKPGGQLVLAAWEGRGEIDYGEQSDLVAFRFSRNVLINLLSTSGFCVDRCVVENIAEMSMDAIYIDATCV